MNSKTYSRPVAKSCNYTVNTEGKVFNKHGHEMRPVVNQHGYEMVSLSDNGAKKSYSVHRLVAEAFIPNPDCKRTVNHIDGNKRNNNVSNLEWCTHGENEKHAYVHNLRKSYLTDADRKRGARIHGDEMKRRVRVVENDTVYDSALECAEALGCDRGAISRCCNGLANKHHGLHFEFVD